MNELRLRVDRGGVSDATPWAVLGDAGRIVAEGTGCGNLPKAQRTLIVVPDDVVTVVHARLPKLPKRKLLHVLPAAVEEQLVAPIDRTDLRVLGELADGRSAIAAWDIQWRAALLDDPAIRGMSSVRVAVESWGLPLRESDVGLMLGPRRCVLRLPGWITHADDLPDGQACPQLIRRMLVDQGTPRAVRLFDAQGNVGVAQDWLKELDLEVAGPQPFDWRTATFAQAPILFQRQRVKVEPGAVLESLRLPAAIAAGWLLFEILGALVRTGIAVQEVRALRASQERIFHAAMGGGAAMVDGEVQMRRQAAKLRATRGEVRAEDFLALMTRLSGEWRDPMPPLAEIGFDDNRVTLSPRNASGGADWLRIAKSAGLDARLLDAARGIVVVAP